MNQWFRMYHELLDDPKVQRLTPTLFKTWVNLLCLAARHSGVLPPTDDIAFHLRLSATDAGQQLDELILAGLIDIMPDGTRAPHNWSGRQFQSDGSAERMRRHRQKQRDVTCDVTSTVTVTPPDSDPDTDSESTPLPPEQEAPPEKGEAIASLIGAGRGGEPSVEAKRAVARLLGLGEVEPLVAIYLDWRPSARARDPDALFRRAAPKLLANAPPAVRAACRPLAETGPPEPLPAVSRPSSNLMNTKLVQGSRRHAHRLVS